MEQPFNITPGIYVVPNFGRIDCTKPLPPETQVTLYLNPAFSTFISATKDGIALLKKEKPTVQQIARLLQSAKSEDEVNWLLDVKSNKALQNIAEIKIKALTAK